MSRSAPASAGERLRPEAVSRQPLALSTFRALFLAPVRARRNPWFPREPPRCFSEHAAKARQDRDLAEPANTDDAGRSYSWMQAEVAELADAPDSKSGGVKAPCGFDSHLRHWGPFVGCSREGRNPHRRRRLPRPERRHPGGRAAVVHARARGRRRPRGLAGACRWALRAARRERDLRAAAARGHHPRAPRARTRTSWTAASRPCSSASRPRASTRSWRSAARTRSGSRRASTPSTSCRSSASRRRSTTTSPAPTTPSASTRPSSSAPRRSTGCTRPPSRTTA